MKIALLSTYPEKECGISKYNEHLMRYAEKISGSPVEFDYYKLSHSIISRGGAIDLDITKTTDFINMLNTLREQYDLVHINYDNSIFFGGDMLEINCLNLLSFVQALHIPTVITLHSDFSIKNASFTTNIFKSIMDVSNVSLVVLGEAQATWLKETFGTAKNIYYLPHGFFSDLKIFTQKEKERLNFLKKKYSKNIKLVTLGFISQWKNQLKLIRLLPHLLVEYPYIKLFIAGSDKYGKQYVLRCLKVIKELKLTKNVVLINKYLSDSDYKIYLHLADIYVAAHSDKDQSVSGTLSYAISAEKPVVAPPINYLSSDSMRRCVLTAQDKNQFIRNILLLVRNKSVRKEIERACRVISKNWDWTSVAQKYLSIYRKTISRSKKRVDRARYIFYHYPKSIGNMIKDKKKVVIFSGSFILYQPVSFPLARFGKLKVYQYLNTRFIFMQIRLSQYFLLLHTAMMRVGHVV